MPAEVTENDVFLDKDNGKKINEKTESTLTTTSTRIFEESDDGTAFSVMNITEDEFRKILESDALNPTAYADTKPNTIYTIETFADENLQSFSSDSPEYFEKVKEKLSELGTKLANVSSDIWKKVKEFAKDFKGTLAEFWEKVRGFFNGSITEIPSEEDELLEIEADLKNSFTLQKDILGFDDRGDWEFIAQLSKDALEKLKNDDTSWKESWNYSTEIGAFDYSKLKKWLQNNWEKFEASGMQNLAEYVVFCNNPSEIEKSKNALARVRMKKSFNLFHQKELTVTENFDVHMSFILDHLPGKNSAEKYDTLLKIPGIWKNHKPGTAFKKSFQSLFRPRMTTQGNFWKKYVLSTSDIQNFAKFVDDSDVFYNRTSSDDAFDDQYNTFEPHKGEHFEVEGSSLAQ